MKWHRQRCPTGNIKISVGEAQGSLTPMGDLTQARLLVNVLCVYLQILRAFHHRKKRRQSPPAPCAAPATRCTAALLQRGACCLAMITCTMFPLVCTCHLSINLSTWLLAMSQTGIDRGTSGCGERSPNFTSRALGPQSLRWSTSAAS